MPCKLFLELLVTTFILVVKIIWLLVQGINEKIMSLNYEEYNFEIETVDAQHSFNDGVIVLVTGCLTGKANIQKKFTQSFFLAPQDNGGYFVLNDVFRYVSESQAKEDNSLAENTTHDFSANTHASPDPGDLIGSGNFLLLIIHGHLNSSSLPICQLES